jgi:hypothetical protein
MIMNRMVSNSLGWWGLEGSTLPTFGGVGNRHVAYAARSMRAA